MRKIHLYLTILIALSLVTLFVACEKDEDIDLTMISVASEQATPSYTSAKIECRFATKATLRNVYAQYATSQDFAEYDEKEMADVDGVYTVTLDDLLDNTVYYVRYAVFNRYSSAMVEEISTFKTLIPSVPSIVLDSITSVWDTYANVKIRLAFDGGAPIQEMGVCWGTQAAPVVENNKLTTKDTHAVLEIKDLQPNTKYYLRAYAKNKMGVAYSDEYTFMTYALPEIKTEEITDIQLTTALLNGTLIFNGNDTATVTGFCWGTNEEPTVANEHAEVLTASASYTYHLSNLKNETKYYVRAYAQNRIGVVYGEVKSFTTLSAVIPTVTTSTVSQITETTAVAGGNVTSDGGASVTERGVVYSTSSNPTTANSKVASGSGTGAFTCNLTGLQPNTTYYVRAYAVNSKGTSYGDEVSFTTNEEVVVTPEYVDLGMSVKWATFNVGATKPEEYGDYFAWGETEPKEVYDWSTYFEVADDVAAVKWGGKWRMPTMAEQDELRTQCTWTWTSQNGVKGYRVTGTNGNSIFLPAAGYRSGSSLYNTDSKGFYWSSSLNSGNASYAYYVSFTSIDVSRYSNNRCHGFSVRPVYGAQVAAPTVVTSTVTQIEETTAVAGGNVTSDGGASVTERGVVYSTSSNPTTANSKVTSGSGAGSFACNLTGLQPNTTYYVRAYAVNSKGTAYGDEVSFTTNEKVFAIPEYVDLGLSVKWATFNVGATKPEEYGDYFAWGETESKSTYSWSNYKWCKGSETSLTKYCNHSGYGTVDNKTTLELSDDAAAVNLGGDWRMPTKAEQDELREQCTWTWTNQNGVNGYKVTSKSNGKSIFLPAAGHRIGISLNNAGSDGNYWSSSLYADSPYYAYYLLFNSSNVGWYNFDNRYYGFSVRPVYGAQGEQVSAPTVVTSAVTQIEETTAVAGGNVTSDGGASVTERGVVYSTSSNPTTASNKVASGSGTGAFTCNLTGLQPTTTYYVRAYAVNSKGTSYGEEVSFTTKIQFFSVSATKKVTFSPSNLQYHPANNEWRFAENQTDYIGASNRNCSSTYNGWLDLFGWSTSATNFGVCTSTSNSDYSGSFVDWGTNKIGNDAPNTWRTLTYAEWEYLLNTRPNASSLKGIAQVNGVNGLILLPDKWTCPSGVIFKSGFHSNYGLDYYAAYQTFIADQWTKLEIAGAVFLPAAGLRYGTSVGDLQSCGCYWSPTVFNPDIAYYLFFCSDEANMSKRIHYSGHSVRLVKDL